VKGNGKPLFVLANAVDDRTMAISHVIRGEEHLPNTPKQIMLWQALNEATAVGPPPARRSPISRCWSTSRARSSPSAVTRWRWRCTASRATCPAAFRNYLALLGWSPGDEEIVPLQVIERFRIEDVQRSPAFFDIKKLTT
jgi:glutamyl-tRNA synthetase